MELNDFVDKICGANKALDKATDNWCCNLPAVLGPSLEREKAFAEDFVIAMLQSITEAKDKMEFRIGGKMRQFSFPESISK